MVVNAAQWIVDQLRAQAESWAAQVRDLQSMKVPTSLEAQRRELLQSAKTIYDKIKTVWPGFDMGTNLGGVFAVVPIAIITASAAMITAWVVSYNKFKVGVEAELERERRAEFERLSVQVGPERAAEIIKTQLPAAPNGGGFFDNLAGSAGGAVGTAVAWGAIAFGLIWFVRSQR
jgi:hypothetical protein